MKKIILLLVLTFSMIKVSAQQCTDRPIINDFSPKTGFIGSTVTITGANFSATPSENQVFFGATEATVVSSSFGTLEVRVPEGSTTALISVKNQCNLNAFSKTHFNGIFCPTPLTNTSYQNTAQELAVSYGAYNMISQDMDNDGKPDMVIAGLNGGLSIAKNNSTPGNISFSAYNFGSNTRTIAVADFDGDGFKDLATNFNILRNTSTGPGNFGLAVAISNSRSVSGYQIGVGDFNNDGKIDIIGSAGSGIYVAFNTSTGPGNFNFTTRQFVGNAGTQCTGIQIADVDGDGKADFLGSQGNSNRAVSLRNVTPDGSMTASFETPEFWSSDSDPSDGVGQYPYRAMIADFDKDGKIDFTSCNFRGSDPNVAIWRNTSVVGDISFAPTINLSSPNSNYRIGVGDVDGDGYPDVVTKSSGSNVFSVYKNTTSSAGNVTFNARLDFTSSSRAEVSGLAIGDLDGDFVPDIATSGISSRTIRFHRNTGAQNDVTPPTVACRNITVALSPSGTVTITPDMIDDGSGDACGIESLVLSETEFTCANIGENTVTLTATDGAGNSASCTAIVNVQPAAIIVAGQSTVCQGETVEMNANLGDSYQWKKDGVNITGATTQNYVATETGDYTVVVTNAGGCSGESLVTPVVVNENPTVDISPAGSTFLCPPNNSAILTASQSSIYQWMKDGVDIPNATQQTYEATTAGNYSVRVIDLFGCSAISQETSVSENPTEIEISNNGVNVTNGPTVISDGFNLDYGNVFPNNNYDTLITIDNTSNPANNSILNVDLVISGPDAQYFSAVDLTFPVGISPGTQGNFALVFNGPDIRAYNATVTILSNDCDEASTTINVTAEITCEAASFTSSPIDINTNTDAGSCNALVNYLVESSGNPEPTITYNFSGATNGSGTGTGSGQTFNSGTTLVTLNIENACGSETQSFNVVVTDNEPPSITTQDITVQLDSNGNTSIVAADVSNGTTDNCALESVTVTPNQFTCQNYGENTVTVTATDVYGNSNTATATVTVGDGTMQTSFNQSDYINNGNSSYLGNGEYRLTRAIGGQFGAVWYQNKLNLNADFNLEFDIFLGNKDSGADGMAFVLQPLSTNQGSSGGGLGYQGINPSLAVEFDTYRNSSDPSQDHVALMKNGTVNHFSSNNLSGPFTVSNLENGAYHSLKISWEKATNNFKVIFKGNTIINYTGDIINDIFSGNSGVFWGFTAATGGLNNDQRVKINTVEFVEELSISESSITAASCPDSLDGAIDINVTPVSPCTTYSWSNGATTQDISGLNPGDYSVTVTQVDGTSVTETFTVTGDVTPPTLSTQNITVELDENGIAAFTADMIDTGSSDNCGIASITISENTFECEDLGSGNSVVFEVTDTSGNTNATNVQVTVVDNIAPTVITQNIDVYLDASGNASITAGMIDNGSFDNCTFSLSLDTTNFGCENVGSNVVNLTAVDASGLQTTAQATVTVIDNILPTAVTQNITVQLDASGNVAITSDMINNGSSDNCSFTTSLDVTSFTCANVGDNLVTLSVTDASGNVSTANATVTVEDNIAPTVNTQSVNVTLLNGEASITPQDVDNGTFDNCSFNLSLDNDNFDCNDIGENTVTLTATDASGNTSSKTAIVNVIGDIPTVSINDFTAVTTQNNNTIYLGYGPQSIDLSTVTTGGSGFTYNWSSSTGESIDNIANPTISPNVSTTYYVTVTNSNGCISETASIEVCVIDARGYNKKGKPNGKVTICHHTNGKKGTKHVTITVSPNAVPAHLQHGLGTGHADSLGGCNAVCIESTNQRSNIVSENIFSFEDVVLYPNPSSGIFSINIPNNTNETRITLIDLSGKVIETKLIKEKSKLEKLITVGRNSLSSGIYLIKISNIHGSLVKKVIVSHK